MSIRRLFSKKIFQLRKGLWLALLILSLGVLWGWWTDFDLRWGVRLVLSQDDRLYSFAFLFTQLFRWEMATLLTIALAYLLLKKHKKRYAMDIVLAMVFAVGLAALMKWGFGRLRPFYSTIVEKGYAYPSGHSAAASALVSSLCLVYREMVGKGRRYRVAVFLSALLAGVIGLTRLALGVHFVTDILGGFLLGYLSAEAVHSFTKS